MAIAVLVTVPERDAERLAKKILACRLCACVNIVKGVKSFFWWKGKLDKAKECILIIKTKETLFNKLKTAVEKNHPYEVPEIISFKINGINRQYLNWLNSEANAV